MRVPDHGNGNAGYPLKLPDAATCALAATHTGKPYTWVPAASAPLYWIYGGAGLEGGPPMMEPGSQQYKCGRCHTTGWTGNNVADRRSRAAPNTPGAMAYRLALQ